MGGLHGCLHRCMWHSMDVFSSPSSARACALDSLDSGPILMDGIVLTKSKRSFLDAGLGR